MFAARKCLKFLNKHSMAMLRMIPLAVLLSISLRV